MIKKELAITNRVLVACNGMLLEHQFHDTEQQFRHRLVRPETNFEGEWIGYEWFATLETEGRLFAACMDNWQPMFPNVFEVIPGVEQG